MRELCSLGNWPAAIFYAQRPNIFHDEFTLPLRLYFCPFIVSYSFSPVVVGSGITMRLGEGVRNGEACAG